MSFIGKCAGYGVLAILGYGFVTGQFNDVLPASDGTQAAAHTSKTAAKAGSGIPDEYKALYEQWGGHCPGLSTSLLAGVGKTESDHGQSKLPGVRSGANKAGAMGPMQFKRKTWDEVRGFDPGIGADVYDPANAVRATAVWLCHYAPSKGGIDGALRMYGGSAGYVTKVHKNAASW